MSQSSWQRRRWWVIGGVLACLAMLAPLLSTYASTFAQDAPASAEAVAAPFDGPTTSSPIALSQDKSTVWVVSPDDGSVTVLGTLDNATILTTVKNVGEEPQAITLDTGVGTAQRAYVVSPPDNSVTILKVNSVSPFQVVVEKRITTGAEPWNVVASPDGAHVFIANSGQDTITVIRTDTQAVIGNIELRNSLCNVGAITGDRHFQPRGLAITSDSTRLYVTRFLSFTKSGGKQGDDNGREGVVCRLNIDTTATTIAGYTPAAAIPLAAQLSGFKFDSNGDRVPDTDTSAYPNQLQSIVIRGTSAYLPNIAASPTRPLVFNVDTQAFVNRIDNVNAAETDGGALNLHLGARRPETGKKRLFFANPWAMAFTNQIGDGFGYAVSAGSDLLVKVKVNAAGVLTFTGGISTTTYIDLNNPGNTATSGRNAGKNPLGIVIRDNKAFVMNYLSRNVSVVNLVSDSVEKVIETTALPPKGSFDEQLQVGAEMFFSSRGHFEAPAGQTATVSLDDRLSSEGWQNCASCHFAGLTDGVVWQFGAGPRKSVSLNATWSPHNPDDQRVLNYSAIFDEVQDFELNIRNVSGPGFLPPPAAANTLDPNHGLIISDTGNVNFAPAVVNAFARPNAGRPQLLVRLPDSTTAWPALDAMKEWVRFAIRTPEGALTADELTVDPDGGGPNQGNPDPTGGLILNDVKAGRRLFFKAGCQNCHGGTKWTISNKDFTSPPAGTEIFCEVDLRTPANPNVPPGCQTAPPAGVTPINVQFLNRFLSEINSFNLGVAGQGNDIGGNVGAIEVATNGQLGLGKDHNLDTKGKGFNIPALLGIEAVPPYYHNGACETLACVLSNKTHRTANNTRHHVLGTPADQAKVVTWLRTLDAETPFPTDLSISDHNIFFDPTTVVKGTKVVIGANIQLFGTRSDLTDILQDLGLTDIKVRIEADPGLAPIELSLPVSRFRQDFGQAVITTTWDVPANPSGSFGTVEVTIDPANQLLENKEDNNIATRSKRLRNPAPDTVAPTISEVFINNDDQQAASTNVKVKILAADTGGSGLDSYCIVRYRYKQSERLWEPLKCAAFKPLPAPAGDGSFTVDAELVNLAGVTYAFVWVKDKAGNTSNAPGFDVINLITSAPVEIDRNDVRIFRFILPAGSPLTLKFKLTAVNTAGDLDISVFDHFRNRPGEPPTRCAVSAQNGRVDEQVSLPGTCAADSGDGRFFLQVEARAVANSRFTLELTQGAEVAAAEASAPSAVNEATTTITVGGPPLRAAIEDVEDTATASNVFMPVVSK